MNNQAVFQRYEMKYLITEAQYARLKEKICRYMIDDRYGQSSICNLYFDTPSFLLIRRSIERPVYKEKLRLRSYGVAVPDSTVFIEMKRSTGRWYISGGSTPQNRRPCVISAAENSLQIRRLRMSLIIFWVNMDFLVLRCSFLMKGRHFCKGRQ